MEPLDDKELNQLLRKWEAPAAPASMRMPASPSSQSPWRWLWAGRIHVPVPVGVGIVFALVAFGIYSSRSVPTAVSPAVGSAVAPPVAPTTPEPPAATPPVEHISPPVTENDKAATAALSGFQPVPQLEPKIVRVQP